jgi:glycolate oxidase
MIKTLFSQQKSLLSKLIAVVGKSNVLYQKEDLYCYAFDTMDQGKHAFLPDYVILPENAKQVSEIVKIAAEHRIPIIPRGAGTNHVGACVALSGGIILHFSKMNKILDVDVKNLTCKVQPGVVLDDLQNTVEQLGFFFPPDPSNLKVSTIGGAVALSSSGPRHFKYGGTKEYVLNLEVVDSHGRIFSTGKDVKKNVSGYDITGLFVGSEGTLGVITEITLKLIPKPMHRQIMLAFFDQIERASDAVRAVIQAKLTPSVLDLIDKNTILTIEKFYPTGVFKPAEACLIIEVDGSDEQEIKNQTEKIEKVCKLFCSTDFVVAKTKQEEDKIWFARRSAFAAVAKLAPDVITEDAVVPQDKITEIVKAIKQICEKYNLMACIMGHAGDGNIHPNFSLDLRDETQRKNFELAKDEFFEIAKELGGGISGEHGIGMTNRNI